MRKQDLELIWALAEGKLEDETQARALIDSSPSLRAEYEAQVKSIEALRSTGPAQLADHERSALRRDVWTELRSSDAKTAMPAPWYARWSTATAALVLVVGAGVMLNQQSAIQGALSDNASGVDEPAFTEVGEALSEDGVDSRREELAVGDSAAAPTAEIDTDVYRDFADELRSGNESLDYEASSAFLAQGNTLSECLAEAGVEDQIVVGEVKPPSRSLTLAVSPDANLDASTPISFVDSATCRVVFIAN